MKVKIILFSLSFFLAVGIGYAQNKKDQPLNIISAKVAIKKYHSKDELDRMPKGDLLGLYMERIESLVKMLPYIAFATKPGVTLETLGIPNDKTNSHALEAQFKATDEYIENTGEFQKKFLPYSDTNKLISAIIFYEDIMKSLHEYSEYN
ncbi:hypothetical protein [Aestuariibaculum suncheonense]|uniref:Uncharacterized protein n=1 Tax=Aestuariibaculum suncheonense TaxID=1028745 RepID=A0A8J6UGG3_9FLAO|nr:hypothetical protein [Aestuariibaculum suncheonense]MBD0835034.1 hypothetical protein [Aestuariibaculum suncheonense]